MTETLNKLDSSDIYSKATFFTACCFVFPLALPHSSGYVNLGLILLAVLMYLYMYINLFSLINIFSNKAVSINKIVHLLVTIVVFFGGAYFFTALLDAKEDQIIGIRAFCKDSCDYFDFKGHVIYLQEVMFTYLNGLYYSIVVITTLGDSTIQVKGVLARPLVASEVLMGLGATVFKLSQYYDERSKQSNTELRDVVVQEIRANKSVSSGSDTQSRFVRILNMLTGRSR